MSNRGEENPYSASHARSTPLSEQSSSTGASVFYGVICVVIAALAMLGTLPGRTHGLGLVAKYLQADFELSDVDFGWINLWATLLGAVFCLPAGWLMDRLGSRMVLTLVAAALGATVWYMSEISGFALLFLFVTLTRGFGQSALSVVSITIVGKSFVRGLSWAMSAYSILVGLTFAAAFKLVGSRIQHAIELQGPTGWRTAWAEIGMVLLFGLAPLALLLLRSSPRRSKADSDGADTAAKPVVEAGFTLAEAVATPAFWIFAGATSLYGLAVSGVGLFNQAILEERGFDAQTYYNMLAVSSLISLVAQFAAGALAPVFSYQRLMTVAMGLYALGLLGLTVIAERWQLWCCAGLLGSAGGIIMVTFFAIWSHAFGRLHLGRIQGIAQMLTVLASAVGPLIFAQCKTQFGTYTPILYLLAHIVILFGIAAWFVSLPKRSSEPVATEVALTA